MARLARFALLGRAVGLPLPGLPLPGLPLPGLALALRIVGTAEGDAESASGGLLVVWAKRPMEGAEGKGKTEEWLRLKAVCS